MRSVSVPSALSMISAGPRSEASLRAALEPVLAGHHHVQDDQVRAMLVEHVAHLCDVLCGLHAVTVVGQEAGDEPAKVGVVVDDQEERLQVPCHHERWALRSVGRAGAGCVKRPGAERTKENAVAGGSPTTATGHMGPRLVPILPARCCWSMAVCVRADKNRGRHRPRARRSACSGGARRATWSPATGPPLRSATPPASRPPTATPPPAGVRSRRPRP